MTGTKDRSTTDRIVDAAAELFAERGYAGTTTRAIAESADVNEVTLFRRFGNKLGVLKALGERFAEMSSARLLSEIPDAEDTRATLLAVARNEIQASIENGGVALRLAFDARTNPEVAALVEQGPSHNLADMAAYMADRQQAGQLRDDIAPEVLAEAFASLTSSYVMYRMVMGFLDAPEEVASDKTIEQLFDVFWSGAQGQQCRGEQA